jgi:hypothetical protein
MPEDLLADSRARLRELETAEVISAEGAVLELKKIAANLNGACFWGSLIMRKEQRESFAQTGAELRETLGRLRTRSVEAPRMSANTEVLQALAEAEKAAEEFQRAFVPVESPAPNVSPPFIFSPPAAPVETARPAENVVDGVNQCLRAGYVWAATAIPRLGRFLLVKVFRGVRQAITHRGAAALVIVGLAVGLIWWQSADLTTNHWNRVVLTLLPLVVGPLAAFLPRSGVSGKQRFVRLAVGLLLALAAWWLVPIFGGPNLWSASASAQQYQDELRSLASADYQQFTVGRKARGRLAAEFPQFRGPLSAAEAEWAGRLADDAVACHDADQLADVSAKLAALPELTPGQFLPARRTVFRGKLEGESQALLPLVLTDRYQAAAGKAREAAGKYEAEAKDLRSETDLTKFRDRFEYLAELALAARQPDPE